MKQKNGYAPWDIEWKHCPKLWRTTIVFVIVNLIDLVFTHRIISEFSAAAEANPVARLIYGLGGIGGLYAFKVFFVLLTVYVCHIIHDHEIFHKKHPKTAHRVLWFGIITVGAVVVYTTVTYFWGR